MDTGAVMILTCKHTGESVAISPLAFSSAEPAGKYTIVYTNNRKYAVTETVKDVVNQLDKSLTWWRFNFDGEL